MRRNPAKLTEAAGQKAEASFEEAEAHQELRRDPPEDDNARR